MNRGRSGLPWKPSASVSFRHPARARHRHAAPAPVVDLSLGPAIQIPARLEAHQLDALANFRPGATSRLSSGSRSERQWKVGGLVAVRRGKFRNNLIRQYQRQIKPAKRSRPEFAYPVWMRPSRGTSGWSNTGRIL